MVSLFEKLRRWVDAEDETESIFRVINQKKTKSQNLLQRVFSAVSETLREELIQLPNGKVYLPPAFVIYLNPFDDKSLRKDKRDFFEEALGDLILEKVEEVVGKGKLNAPQIKFSLKVDGNLEEKDIRVEAVLDDISETDEIIKKEKEVNLLGIEMKFKEELGRKLKDTSSSQFNPIVSDDSTLPDDYTMPDKNFSSILYRIELTKNGNFFETIPVVSPEMLIGRESSRSNANIKLPSKNRHISSSHLFLTFTEKGELYAKSLTNNQTVIDDKLLLKDEQLTLSKNSEIKIYEFTLRFKF